MKSLLDPLYEFMSKTYPGNWQYRWSNTPYLQALEDSNKKESILAHQWSCIGFWYHLRRVSPHLDSIINTTELYEILWSHDIGETYTGDISLVMQTQGHGLDKHLIEKAELEKICEGLSSEIKQDLVGKFEAFEQKIEETTKLEVLMAKFIDNIQGNHFALTYGNNLNDYSELISKIVNAKFVKLVNHFISTLETQQFTEAAKEIRTIAHHHIKMISKAGITLQIDRII